MSAVSNKILAQGGKGIGYMINQDGSLGDRIKFTASKVEITFCKDFEGKITLPYKTEDQRDEMFDKLCNETPETLTKWCNDVS